MSTLIKIKELVLDGKVIFTVKAGIEMERDGLLPRMVFQAIINAPVINKTLRSADPETGAREYLHVIISSSYDGTIIYTKGKIKKVENEDTFYILISSKRSIG
ncbi:MAG: hypothetical protein V2A61_06725 [Calditrichota bacterium]